MKNKTEKTDILPNPELERKPCIEACEGCNKVFERDIVYPEGTILGSEKVCISYFDPAAKHKLGCPMQSNKVVEIQQKKKINPLKHSRRMKRRGF